MTITQETAAAAATTIDADELAEFVAVAREYGERAVGRLALELDVGSPEAIDRCWRGLGEIGLDRCLLDQPAGGAGLPDGAMAPLTEAVAGGDGGVALLMLSSNIALAVLPQELTAKLVDNARWAYVPTSGVRAAGDSLPALIDGRLTGTARFALGTFGADGYVFECRDGEELALAAVVAGADGLIENQVDDQLALGAAAASELVMLDTPATRIGGAAEAARADALVNAGTAAIARGTAHRAGMLALEYAENRYQGGGRIIIHGAVRDMLGRMSEREIGMAPPVDLSGPVDPATALAQKIAATDAAVETTMDAVQVFGGMGYMHETGVEKLMRDAKYCQLWPVPNWVGRDALLELRRGR
ncbi:MAG: acyl-CoA/acyl-ACP dehydrogenase [Thermoleophilaceae bacterium]|nr:acyl-CoA/acyl-ACP dehydrogenase [Thermoleophilaceae bacterium]